ncbi:MAG: PIN domain-containing protein [Chloroflexota bacterium]
MEKFARLINIFRTYAVEGRNQPKTRYFSVNCVTPNLVQLTSLDKGDANSMQTVLDKLQEMSNHIISLMQSLFLEHSSIYDRHKRNNSGVLLYPRYAFQELNEDGRQIQAQLLEEYNRYYSIIHMMLAEHPAKTQRELERTDKKLRHIIEQRSGSHTTTKQAFEEATAQISSQTELLKGLYALSSGRAIYIPDTNALLYNIKLETWAFVNSPTFTIVLLPTILGELDSLKINYRNENVREKAETLIRQIKEYRRRGNLTEGVPIVSNTIDLVAFASEPKQVSFLPWQDITNNDDRFIASAMEVTRKYPRSPVIIVTRDINLQNKAEYTRLPYVEPPEE